MLKTGNVSLERLDTRCSAYSGSDFSNLVVHCCRHWIYEEVQAYWKESKQTVAFEEVEFICQPLKDDLNIWIIKTEYWELNKNSHHKKYVVDYKLQLPGVG